MDEEFVNKEFSTILFKKSTQNIECLNTIKF
jgi:hypothetical protein